MGSRVRRAVLEKMSNQELEQYFKPGNSFDVEAVQLALIILQERSYIFNSEQIKNITLLIEEKNAKENRGKLAEESKETLPDPTFIDFIVSLLKH